jgi:hypothetical protein
LRSDWIGYRQHSPALLSRRAFCKTAGIAAAGLALPLGGCTKPPVEEPPKVFTVEELAAKRAEIAPYQELLQVSQGRVLGLNSDGTVRAVVGRDSACDVSEWEDVVSIRMSNQYAFGLKRDGTVYVTRYSGVEDELPAVSQWSDVIKIELGSHGIFGITSEGTVLMAGDNDNNQADVSGWTDIVAVSSGYDYTLGLKADGTVVATGDTARGRCDVEDWTDVTAVYATTSNSYGLTLAGRVLVTGSFGKKETIEAWTDVVEFYPLNGHPAGLKADGTIVQANDSWYWTRDWRNAIATGVNNNHNDIYFGIDVDRNLLLREDTDTVITGGAAFGLSTWSDIVAIAGDFPYVALKSDGTVVSLYTGVVSNYGFTFIYDFSDWRLF